MKSNNLNESGVTALALVVTIIIMIILAGIVIANISGEDGLISQTHETINSYEEYKQGEEEKIEELASGIKKSNEKIQVLLSLSTADWTNGDVIANAEVRNKPDGYYLYMKLGENGSWKNANEIVLKASEYSGPQKVIACIAKESNPSDVKPERQVSITISNIDTEKPNDLSPMLSLKTETSYKTIVVECKQSDNISGLNESETKYAIRKKGETSWGIWQSNNVFDDLEDGTTYEIKTKAVDKAGNEQESGVSEIKTKTRISLATIVAIPNQTYTGYAITPVPTITYNGDTLLKDTDYTLTYNNNINAGTATVTVTGIGNYTLSKITSFIINRANGSGSVTMAGWIAGNTASNPVPVSSTNGTSNVSYQYKVSSAADSTYGSTKPSTAGTYTVKATFAQTNNFNSCTATANFTIQAALYSVSSGSPTYHRSLSSAVSTCSAGGTVTALANTSESNSFTINKNITINPNGKTLTRTAGTITISANTTIVNSSGTITHTGSAVLFSITGGTLSKSGSSTLSSNKDTVYLNASSAKLNLSGGTITGKYAGISQGNRNDNDFFGHGKRY